MDLVYAISLFQGLRHGEDTQVGRVRQLLVQVIEMDIVVTYETMHSLSDHTKTLLHDLLEALTDRHDLADGFHAGTDLAANADELRQVPTRDLHDHIIYLRRFVRGVRSTHLADLVQSVAQRQLSGDESQWITAGLGCQGGRTAQASVHLDHTVIASLGVESVLDITFTHDT